MALLKDNKYIKLTVDGKIYVYKSKEAREKHKQAPSTDIVLALYDEQILKAEHALQEASIKYNFSLENLSNPETKIEEIPNEILELAVKACSWSVEKEFFKDSLTNNTKETSFPLAEALLPAVADSIPDLEYYTESQWFDPKDFDKKFTELDEVYSLVKNLNMFGDTENC